jgi:S-adenosylmethionine decarboxylase
MIRECKVIGLWPQYGASSGLHLLVEWYGCGARRMLIEDADPLRLLCLAATEGAELPIVDLLFRQRAPEGVVGMMLLGESHLAIHTRPEDRSVSLDVFVGSRARNGRAKAHAVYSFLKERLAPRKEDFLQVNRGGLAERGSPSRRPAG